MPEEPIAADLNPLLHPSAALAEPVDFRAIKPSHMAPAISALLQAAQAALQTVTQASFPASWESLSQVLETTVERLGIAWGAVAHLNAVADTPELRAAYNALLPEVSQFYTSLSSSPALYAKYQAIDATRLNAEQAQAHQNTLRDFRLGGAALPLPAQRRFEQIAQQLAELAQKFNENVLDATEAFAYEACEEELAGLPADVIAAAADEAAALDGGSASSERRFRLTLRGPCYAAVMAHAHNRSLRERLYRAYTTRASDFGPPHWDNTGVILSLLSLKAEQAQLLGFSDYAALSLATKMAPSTEAVITFLRDLAKRARPFAQQDVQQMRDYAREHLHLTDVQAWDYPFIAQQLKEKRFSYNETEVKQYFQLPRVLAGLFAQIESLFGVHIQAESASTWDAQVQFFSLRRTHDLSSPIAYFYLDTAARAGKRSGAWMDEARGRWRRPDTQAVQLPIAHLVCNCTKGVNGQPPLLTHDDVITLFHEFGHGLHHMLTTVDERTVAGINGVAWDAVELPSQFMENLCWEWPVLQGMSAHVETGEPLPQVLFDRLVAAKHFQSGLHILRQVEYALFDILLHAKAAPPANAAALQALLDAVRAEVALIPAPAFNRMPHSFSHIFAGGYAAGYYSYHWAEVLSADAYAAFEEALTPADRAATAQRFLSEVLSRGGSRPALASFVAFRGRPPSLQAFLRHSGLLV